MNVSKSQTDSSGGNGLLPSTCMSRLYVSLSRISSTETTTAENSNYIPPVFILLLLRAFRKTEEEEEEEENSSTLENQSTVHPEKNHAGHLHCTADSAATLVPAWVTYILNATKSTAPSAPQSIPRLLLDRTQTTNENRFYTTTKNRPPRTQKQKRVCLSRRE